MDDLISREAVKKELEELIRTRRHWLSDGSGEIRGIEVAYCAIDGFPTVDAVEVVRCQHCKHRFNGEHHDNCCDVLMEKVKWTFEVTVEPDWFCADGERKTDG